MIAARIRGELKSAFAGPPALAGDQKRPDDFPAHKAQTDGPANLVVVADSDILSDRYWVRVSDFFGQQVATPFADNGPFVANLIGTLAGGDALIGLRSRGDTNHPFVLVALMQSDAEARFRQTEQGLQKHLEDVEKQLRSLRQGGTDSADKPKADAVITPEQRAAIDAARKDIVDTRQKLRAVQLELNRDISRLETTLRVFNIVMIPVLLTVRGHCAGAGPARPPGEGAVMKQQTLAALVVAGVVAVAGGWYFGTATTPTEQRAVAGGALMFPDLAPKLQNARTIEVIHQGKPTVIALRDTPAGKVWGIADKGGYRVQDSRLRGMLTALTELRLVEARTSDPAQFGRLGVEDRRTQGIELQSPAGAGRRR